MPKQTPPLDPFIVVDNPGRQETKENRKKIRSRAARHSHEVGRRSYKAERSARSARLSEISDSSPVSQYGPQPPVECSPNTQELALTRGPHVEAQQYAQQGVSVRPPVHDGISFPVPEQAFYRSTIAFMWKWMLDAWNVLEVTELERIEAMIWVQRLTMSSPPYFYMNMLSCCTTLAEKGLFDARMLSVLLAQTIRAINDSLSKIEHAPDIGLILTVGRIALRECVRGNLEVGIRIHRPAQARMLAMAGGLEALDIPTLVRKHLMWAERLVVRRTGVSLSDLDPGAIRQDTVLGDDSSDQAVLSTYRLIHRQTAPSTDKNSNPG